MGDAIATPLDHADLRTYPAQVQLRKSLCTLTTTYLFQLVTVCCASRLCCVSAVLCQGLSAQWIQCDVRHMDLSLLGKFRSWPRPVSPCLCNCTLLPLPAGPCWLC